MHLCPNCGCDLASREPVELGNIALTEKDEIVFQGRRLDLSRCQFRIVESLVRARGRSLTRGVLAQRVGGDVNDSTIVKYVERVRHSFRAVEPAFDQLVAVHGFGAYRWSERSAA
jgi:DNA-binding response OmpR family regulator